MAALIFWLSNISSSFDRIPIKTSREFCKAGCTIVILEQSPLNWGTLAHLIQKIEF